MKLKYEGSLTELQVLFRDRLFKINASNIGTDRCLALGDIEQSAGPYIFVIYVDV